MARSPKSITSNDSNSAISVGIDPDKLFSSLFERLNNILTSDFLHKSKYYIKMFIWFLTETKIGKGFDFTHFQGYCTT